MWGKGRGKGQEMLLLFGTAMMAYLCILRGLRFFLDD